MAVSKIKMAASGPHFSRMVMGVWRWTHLSSEQILALVEQSVACGITTFDHADIYGGYTCEEAFGKALAGRSSLYTNIQIVTKCGIKLVNPNRPHHKLKSYDTSREHIITSVENSLRNLQTDHIDLLLLHRPDPLLAPDEVAEAFRLLQKEGKVLYFGVSNFTTAQFSMLQAHTKLVTNQIELSLLSPEPIFSGVIDQCMQQEISPMAWSPLGGGRIFAEHPDAQTERIRSVARQISEAHQGATLDQILLAWLLRHPAKILPVLGTTKIENIRSAAAAIDLVLSRDEWFALLEAARGYQVP